MKQLIFGIDGGDYNILSKMPAPYLNSLFENTSSIELSEDILSRGWAEMISGLHASNTNALYMKPLLDGSHTLRLKYSLKELLSNSDVTPVWELAERNHYKVGVMGVPTTFPAPEVNGFFVSGAGGGVNKVEGIPVDLCHPKSLANELEELGYIIDLRFGSAGIKDIQVLFDRLNEMMRIRIESFIKLCKKNNTDFGFLATRATTVVQYLAMSEIERYFLFNEGCLSEDEAKKSKIWFDNFQKHYSLLDSLIKQVFEELNPEHWILVADHGIVPYRYKLDMNAFLLQNNFQQRNIKLISTTKKLIKSIFSTSKREISYQTDWSTTKAFSHWYLSGVFINDKKRFLGPVQESELRNLVAEICSCFNKTPEAAEYDMSAQPYRQLYESAVYTDYLPDIKIHRPDTIFSFPGDGEKIVRENEFYGPLPDLRKVSGGMVTGQKSHHPLFCCDAKTAGLIKEDDARDLTLVYKLTDRIINS